MRSGSIANGAAATTAPIQQVSFARKNAQNLAYRNSGSMLEVDLTGSGAHILGLGTMDGPVSGTGKSVLIGTQYRIFFC